MSLKALLEKQKAAKAAQGESNGTTDAATPDSNDVRAGVESVPADGADSASAPAKPRLGFIGAKKATPTDTTAEPAKSRLAQDLDTLMNSEPKQVAVASLDDLMDSEDMGTAEPVSEFAFPDEVPADAPTRELPEELTDQQLQFVKELDSLYAIMHDPELFGGFIRNIMGELQSNPDYIKLMADQDVHTMIRGLRSSMGLARIKKIEKTPKSKAAKKVSAAGEAVLTAADQMFNADDW